MDPAEIDALVAQWMDPEVIEETIAEARAEDPTMDDEDVALLRGMLEDVDVMRLVAQGNDICRAAFAVDMNRGVIHGDVIDVDFPDV